MLGGGSGSCFGRRSHQGAVSIAARIKAGPGDSHLVLASPGLEAFVCEIQTRPLILRHAPVLAFAASVALLPGATHCIAAGPWASLMWSPRVNRRGQKKWLSS